MIMHPGGTVVERGLYWNPMDGRRVTMRKEGTLPGAEHESYLKMSPGVLLVVAPLFGVMFMMFLPLFGIGVFVILWLAPLIGTLAEVAVTGVKVCCRVAGKGALFHWNPTRVYFSGVRKKKKVGGRAR